MNNSSENFIKPLYQDDSDESDGPDDTSQYSDSPHAAQYIDEHDLDEEDEFEADRLKFPNSNVSNGVRFIWSFFLLNLTHSSMI